jgi:hypothetical protein
MSMNTFNFVVSEKTLNRNAKFLVADSSLLGGHLVLRWLTIKSTIPSTNAIIVFCQCDCDLSVSFVSPRKFINYINISYQSTSFKLFKHSSNFLCRLRSRKKKRRVLYASTSAL